MLFRSDLDVIDTVHPRQQTSEGRIFQPNEKVNVVYRPENGMKNIILARAVDHAMASRVINSYVARTQGDNTKQPLRIQDFVMQPVNYNYTRESAQFGSKQEVINHFVKQGKSAAAGAAAWEKGWRGPKIKTPKHQPPKAPEPQQQQRYWWQDREELEEYGEIGRAHV